MCKIAYVDLTGITAYFRKTQALCVNILCFKNKVCMCMYLQRYQILSIKQLFPDILVILVPRNRNTQSPTSA